MRVRGAALATSFLALALLAGCSSSARKRGYRAVAPGVAFEMLRDTPDLLIVDLRSSAEYVEGHVNGAVNVPLEAIEPLSADLARWKTLTFLLYCRAGDDCGVEGVKRFVSQGFRRAVLIEGGIENWKDCSFGVVEGEKPVPGGE